MRLLDANLLLYAVDARSPRHHEARRWLEAQLRGSATIAELCSCDTDFARFVGLRWVNPLRSGD